MVRKTILLVEDDADARDLLQDVLEERGFDVVPAGHGRQALEYLRMSRPARPALVILDIMLPIVDGIEVLQAMRSDPELADIPVIVMSALLQDRPEGASAFIRKPIPMNTLFDTVSAFTSE
jgi:CheY-like chemotaxis protein